jgi:hypothetical protein
MKNFGDAIACNPGGISIMAEHPDREALLRETHQLNRELGYAGFRSQYFNDPDAIEEWPDPATRERELRAFWDGRAEQAYPSYREQFADVSTDDLADMRDHLRATLADGSLDPADYYNRASEAGRRVRSREDAAALESEPALPESRADAAIRITREIEEAVTSNYLGEGLLSVLAPGQELGRMFIELSEAVQWKELNERVNWSGITAEEKDAVMARVLGDVREKIPEEIYPGTWFDGVLLSVDGDARVYDMEEVRRQIGTPDRSLNLDERVCSPGRLTPPAVASGLQSGQAPPSLTAAILSNPQSFLPDSSPSHDHDPSPERGR